MRGIRGLKVKPGEITNGHWFEYPANTDGTIPAVLLARQGNGNRKYTAAFTAATKPFAREIELNILHPDKDAEISLAVFCDTILLDWRNWQPDDDGKAISFSKAVALEMLAKDEWSELLGDMRGKASSADGFIDVAVKN